MTTCGRTSVKRKAAPRLPKRGYQNENMGGPCILKSGAPAPACTDNFQVAPFKFDGKEWQSCEQLYQVSVLCAAVALLSAPPQHRFAGVQESRPCLHRGHPQHPEATGASLLLILKRKISHSMSRVKPTRNTARPSLYSAWVFCSALILLPGMACWSEGQRHKMQLRSDWDAVKIDIMYRCFLLHYAHAPARAQLSALNT